MRTILNIDVLCSWLLHPIGGIDVICERLPHECSCYSGAITPVARTFLCITCDAEHRHTLVLYLGSDNDAIECAIIGNKCDEWSEIIHIIEDDGADVAELAVADIRHFASPVFSAGGERVTRAWFIVRQGPTRSGGLIGVVFEFQFGIKLGLHVFDDHRLSVCFNDTCDKILAQARACNLVAVEERVLGISDRPHYSAIRWFDWLR